MDPAKRGRRAGMTTPLCARATIALAFLILLPFLPTAASAESYITQNQFITLFEDGAARIEVAYSVDVLSPTVNLTLLGTTFLHVVATDAGGLPMGYSVYPWGIKVNTLGEALVKVAYTTHDLTGKTGKYWTVNFTSPVPTWIAFPAGATVVSLSHVPETIDSRDGRTVLMMPPGDIAVTYVLSVVGTIDHAFLVISDATHSIQEIAAAGVNVSSAQALLLAANNAFNSGDFASAEVLAGEAKSLALQTNTTAHQASTMILVATTAIGKAESEGRTVGLDEAKSLLSQASPLYAAGNYSASLASAESANAKAAAAMTPLQAYAPYIAVAIVAVATIAIALPLRARGGKKASRGYVKETHEVDLGRIAKEGRLREEDFRIMEFLAENGGEAFESAVRERFNLPKTTIWRMAKRLEKEGYITVGTVAGQNLLRVRNEYTKK